MTPSGEWFDEARFGMFVHWGAYAVAARGEWVRNRERIPQSEYIDRYCRNFLAENYDPAEWARLAKSAGMKYVILTTRHHDGFCLWNTKTTDFNAVTYGAKRDLLAPFAAAVREAGLRVGFYYSFADWHHPDYPDAYARDWPTEFVSSEAAVRFSAFYQAQLEELMSNYGKIDILWYDGCFPAPTFGAQANALVKRLQPEILINERNGEPFDFYVSEQTVKPAAVGKRWEAELTLNDNWGYHAGDFHYKSTQDVIRLLLETAAGGGNLNINVGPRSDGSIPEQNYVILRELGEWLKVNGEFLSNSTRSPFSWNNSGRITTKGSTVYLHLFHSPGEQFCLAEIRNKVLEAHFVATGASIAFEQYNDRLFLTGLPVPLPDPLVTTIALKVEGVPEAITEQISFWIPGD